MNGNIAMELRPGFSERITATSNVQRVTCSLPRPYHGPLTRDIVLFTYSWIGRPVQTYKKIICRETDLDEAHPLVRGKILHLLFLESYS